MPALAASTRAPIRLRRALAADFSALAWSSFIVLITAEASAAVAGVEAWASAVAEAEGQRPLLATAMPARWPRIQPPPSVRRPLLQPEVAAARERSWV